MRCFVAADAALCRLPPLDEPPAAAAMPMPRRLLLMPRAAGCRSSMLFLPCRYVIAAATPLFTFTPLFATPLLRR